MHRLPVWMLASVVVLGSLGASQRASAQFVTVFRPVTPVVTYFAPQPVVAATSWPVVQTVASPVVQTVASPIVQTVASPVVVQPAFVSAPAVPVVTYFRAPTVAYQPVAQVQTRFRPILGGTVSRVRYSYMPVVIP